MDFLPLILYPCYLS
jgi:hypothetical protein